MTSSGQQKKADDPVHETTPLLSPQYGTKIVLADYHLETDGYMYSMCMIPIRTIRKHFIGLGFSLVSAMLCVWSHSIEHRVFDSLIFKSIFIVFGFAIGFRNVRANQRRSTAMEYVLQLFGAAWEILLLYPDSTRPKIAKAFTSFFDHFAEHIRRIAGRGDYAYSFVGLEPVQPREGHYIGRRSCEHVLRDVRLLPPHVSREVNFDARPVMLALMLMCEDEIDAIEKPPKQKLRRSFWGSKDKFFSMYDQIIALCCPSVSERYIALVDLCLGIFAVALPWGIKSEGFQVHKLHLYGGTLLIMNTMMVNLILYSLNTIATEHEDPFDGDADDVDLEGLVKGFRIAVEGYEERLAEVVRLHGDVGPLEKSRLVCGHCSTDYGSPEAA